MKQILLYGSRYGTVRRYAQELSRRTGVPAASYDRAPALENMERVVYLGSLYAGGVTGLRQILKKLPDKAALTVATVGLADGADPQSAAHIRASLKKQLGSRFATTSWFHLRGSIDYRQLSLRHRAMMAALVLTLRKKAPAQLSDGDRMILNTYGGQLDLVDFSALNPLEEAMK